jgi:polyhydroxyalkanoate synthesis regulator protein
MEQILQNFLDESITAFSNYKKLAEKAMNQVSDEEFFRALDQEANSIATITKHIGGNLRSRWTDFLTSDGEKPDRNRDSEFIGESDTRESLMQFWENGWDTLFETLQSLTIEDLGKIVQIRDEDFTVVKAINRAAMHTASHVGQITFLAKHFRSSEWQTLSVPKNKSAEFNLYLAGKEDKGNYLEATQEFAEKDLK